MAKNIIEYYKQTAIYHVRYASENDVLYNNSDENKYVNFTYSGVTYAIRNSAIYYDGSAVYFTLISENPNTVYHQYEENNEWHTGSTNPLDQNINGVYYKTFYKNGNVIYNFSISSSTLDHIVGYDIPYFTDLDAYTAYITNVINDWKNVDWELMDPIKLPSTMRDNYVINYNYDIPIQSGQSWEGFKSYVIPGTMIPVTFGPFVTINFKYGSLIYGADGYGYIAIRDNDGNVISEIRGLLYWLSTTELYLIAGIDEKSKEGRIGLYLRPQSGYGSSVSFNSKSKNKQAYEFITQNLLGATVNVNYYIPDGTYQYAKITYKQNTSPIDQNDGDSVDIDPTLSSVNIKGLEEEKTYWFIIFTDKSESEAFPYTVEVDPVPPEYKQYIEKINGRIKDYEYFYWYDLEQFHPYGYDYIDGYKYVPLTSLSYYCDNVSSGANSRYYAALSKTAVYIVKEDNHYIASIDSNYIPQFDLAGKVTPGWAGRFTQYGYPNNTSDVNNVTRMIAWNSTELVNETPFSIRLRYGDLTSAFTDLSKRVKNIDIYVDGVLWSKVGN